MLKRDLSMGHGDANTITHYYFKSTGEGAAGKAATLPGDVLDEIYAGPKAELRPIHEKLMAAITRFGPFETAPKKGYVACDARNSSRRSARPPRPVWNLV